MQILYGFIEIVDLGLRPLGLTKNDNDPVIHHFNIRGKHSLKPY